MSYQEIAAALQTSVSAVESLLFRARRKLEITLSDWQKK
jgi:DNA-directed RNA polymerase specialized sigma24 family protein